MLSMTKFTFPCTHFILALSLFRENQMNSDKGIQVMAPYGHPFLMFSYTDHNMHKFSYPCCTLIFLMTDFSTKMRSYFCNIGCLLI